MKDNKMNSLLPIYSKISENFIPENEDNFRFLKSKFGEIVADKVKDKFNECVPIVAAKFNSSKTAINVFYFHKERKDRSHSCIHLHK